MNEPPKKIWTPDQKVPESVRKMAFLFYIEALRANLARGTADQVDWQKEYRACIVMAKMIQQVDAENEPPK